MWGMIGAVGEAKVLDGLAGWTLHSSTPADARKILDRFEGVSTGETAR